MKIMLPLAFTIIGWPALALEAIGTVTATLDGTEFRWEILRTDDGAAMVQVNAIGPMTMIDLHAMGDGDFSVGLIFHGAPGADAPPAGVTIDLRPDGAAGALWKSAGAAAAPEFRIDRLDLDGAGRMEAGFTALLCRDDAPTECRTVEGRIDTELGAP
ncbi:hypothetical protein HMH01_13185 [Halovulum dunhuangense]|uniref:CHRD domain-containing protein n=1 Tax=Halovulum dunhuangense TaxID=1505036 RepID=A0A849L5D2_9RHOB|nr:hypothetical protein [Halovulum dunhuangense]NNU81390.1 hypothetical protein [Halovulum dunhuangense]